MAVDLDFVHSATKRYAPANASSRLDLSVDATADAESFYVPSTYQVRGRATLMCFFFFLVNRRLFHLECHVHCAFFLRRLALWKVFILMNLVVFNIFIPKPPVK